MLRCLPALLFLAFAAEGRGQDVVTVSPHKSFKIVQHRDEDWRQVLTFQKNPAKSITLEASIPWPADYHISPDDRWILRIQKTGSGENVSFLYRVDPGSRIWRMEEQVGVLAFAFLARRPDLPKDLYHTGIEFSTWDMKAGLLNFTVRGSDAQMSGNGIRRSLAYRLRDNVIVTP